MRAAVRRRDPRVTSEDNPFAWQIPGFPADPIRRVDNEDVRFAFLQPGQRLGIGIIIGVVDSIRPRQQSLREFALIEQLPVRGLVSTLVQRKIRDSGKRSRRCAQSPFFLALFIR